MFPWPVLATTPPLSYCNRISVSNLPMGIKSLWTWSSVIELIMILWQEAQLDTSVIQYILNICVWFCIRKINNYCQYIGRAGYCNHNCLFVLHQILENWDILSYQLISICITPACFLTLEKTSGNKWTDGSITHLVSKLSLMKYFK